MFPSSHSPHTRPRSSRVVLRLIAVLLACTLLNVTHADVLELRSGGRVDGILLNPDEKPRTKYVMRLEAGGEVTLKAELVKSHLPLSEAQKRYAAVREKMPATADANWKLAEWCKDKGLRNERELHLEAAIQLDPEHAPARYALGYRRLDDQWVKPDAFMRDRGFVLHEGRWRMPQEVEIEKQREETTLAIKKWSKLLKRWRGWLGKRKDAEAIASIRAINDPLAAKALADALAAEKSLPVQQLYVSVLAKLRSKVATKALVSVALTATNVELRDNALNGLDGYGRDFAVGAFIRALESSHNALVNRAAVGLQRFPESQATRPLIEALVTEHKRTTGTENAGQLTTSFGGGTTGDGIGFGSGSSRGGRPQIVKQNIQNRDVLKALKLLSEGADFRYNQAMWRNWLSTRDRPAVVDLRRGP